MGVGAGIDLARAYSARQRLSETAILACQYASRPSIVDTATSSYSGSNGGATYVSKVDSFITTTLSQQRFQWTQTNTAPFTYVQSGAANVSLSASVPTSFMQVIRISQIKVGATSHCYDNPNTPPQNVANGNSTVVLQEGFENSACAGTCYTFYATNGTTGTESTPVNTFTPTVGYTGTSGAQWYIMGYCLEVDTVGIIEGTVPEGTHSAELDCDNGSGTAGNSSISTKTYLAAGNYELRYNTVSRIDYPDYDPAYVCGSTASDMSWANDTNAGPFGNNVLRTNQINVYLDLNTGSAPPTHTTIDGTQTLGGSNLIDMCVYAQNWVQRSIRIKVTTAGYYWLSFAADGRNDSYGGQIDNIMLCQNTCTPSLQDNFPSTWLAANNGGVNKVLFEDTFESPVYTPDPYITSKHTKGGNLALSYGTSGASSGWPNQTSSGWAVAPYNEVVYWEQGATQGNQYFSLQGWNPTTSSDISTYGYTNSGDPINRAVTRSFLLDPGYYNVSYDYASLVDFSYSFVYNGGYYPVCTAAPTTAPNATTYGVKNGYDYASTSLVSQYLSTNFMSVFMSNGQEISTPIINSTLGGAPKYNNPDGTVTSTPKVAPDSGSIYAATYSSSAVNPVIDMCQYSQAYGWVSRSVNVEITKPGYYWLTFSAQGDPLTGAGTGPAIDDVKLTALGSLYMSNPPTTALTAIPVASPQPGASVTYTGFFIIADPLEPPAPLQ